MKTIVIFMSLILLVSCNDTIINNVDKNSGTLHFSLPKVEIPSNVASVDISISKNGSETISKQLDLLNNNSAEVYFNNIEIGMWNIVINAKDSEGIVIYSGEQDIDIKQGVITPVYIKLTPVIEGGSLFIYTDWEDLSKGWIDESTNPILTKSSDTYQKLGVHEPIVLYDEGIYKMWYLGLNDDSRSYMFYATSIDGIQWQQYGSSPVMYPGSNGTWDSKHISPGPVIKENGELKMYYTAWSNQYQNWSIGLATSTDGISWTKYSQNPIIVGNGWDQQLGATSLVKVDSTYYLYYAGKNTTSSDYKIGLATSNDGISWSKLNFPILESTQNWEGGSIGYPCVIYENDIFKMVYQGSDNPRMFSIAYSKDGLNWIKFFNDPFFTTSESNYGKNNINYPFLVKFQNEYRLYYTGTDYNNNNFICVARKFN